MISINSMYFHGYYDNVIDTADDYADNLQKKVSH